MSEISAPLDQGYSSDIAFTPAVKAIQARKGSRKGYAAMEARGGWDTRLIPEVADFISRQRSFLMATASKDGQPYIQHRGGPPGFLRIVDDTTLAFADYAGNRQYISAGNLSENPKAMLFLIDYRTQQRLKIWGEAKMVEGDADLLRQLMPEGYRARGEQVLLFKIAAWDRNCPQHIPLRLDVDEVSDLVAVRDERIRALESEVAELRLRLDKATA
ncbi:MAG TPA: pyridoxamine 5'-phosphate oxidase family protein [Hyphomonadaceae bacterium]|nr:pyridoxamine 5'-phosphate oxidase family protein [Hyphomonadaceae bacterium]